MTTLIDQRAWPTASDGGGAAGQFSIATRGGTKGLVAESGPFGGPLSVLSLNYPTGFSGDGTEPAVVYSAIYGNECYVRFWWRASANWQAHPSSVNKIAFMVVPAAGGGGDPADVLIMRGTSAPYTISIVRESVSPYWIDPNRGSVPITPGNWYQIEWYWRLPSSPGASDSVERVWVNGIQTIEAANLTVNVNRFLQFEFAPTWGGRGADPKTQDDYYRFGPTKLMVR